MNVKLIYRILSRLFGEEESCVLKGLSRIVYLAILSQLLAEHFYVNSNYEANTILSVMFMQ